MGVEAPKGTKDMGGWTASIYTPEQQARLGVTETGETTTKTVFNPPAKTGKVVFSKDPAVQAMVEKNAKVAYIKDPDVQQAQIKAKSKQTANAQRLTESRGTIAVVQGSTTGAGSQSPSRAVTQTNFVQML